ncbi:universal stress protein [Flexivirga caeni]|uniref:Universal stress protein n=1 Tax=Flexivirga caeni TaxID=2294115 RepID=A0A3M9MEJ5_9MICO|nr:universal stress protein [Flexivirga caeni]RNI23048.1 universal stress protein [Flexivirga caeni]
MTILAGFSASRQNPAPVELATQIARTTGEDILAVAVLERRLPAKADPIEDEYIDYLAVQADQALHHATDRLATAAAVRTQVEQARSIPEGLALAAQEHRPSVITVGSSSSGLLGRVTLGSVTERLVHTAAIPVAIAPRGYRAGSLGITRLTVAYGGRADRSGLIESAAGLADSWGVPLRIVSFAVRDVSAFTGTIESNDAEHLVVHNWWLRTRGRIEEQLTEVCETLRTRVPVEVGLGSGTDWPTTVESVGWDPGDLMLFGSGAAAIHQQVFLGSAASRIMRASPVPVMIMPRIDSA